MASRRSIGVMTRLLVAFSAVSILAVAVFVVVEGLGVDSGLDAATPAEEGISRRAHDFLYRWTLLSGLVALAVGLALASRFAMVFVRPIRALAASARDFAAGDRDARCDAASGVRELDDLARSFNTMADVIQAHDASRNRLLSDIAHELRSPLTVVTGQLEEMRDDLVPADREALAAVHAECRRLAATAEDLARLATEDSTGMPLGVAVLDLGAVVGQAVAVRERVFGDAGIRLLASAGDATIRTDEHRVRQILGNLLDNCLRYCRPGDLVRVSTRVDDVAWLIVDDTGPGMTAAERRFATWHGYRGPASAGIPGTGAGLALVQQWTQALGGHVELHQSPLGGLRVAVALPVGGRPDRNPRTRTAPGAAATARPAAPAPSPNPC